MTAEQHSRTEVRSEGPITMWIGKLVCIERELIVPCYQRQVVARIDPGTDEKMRGIAG